MFILYNLEININILLNFIFALAYAKLFIKNYI